ncbi:MAG TPA: APC family permease [Pyrinomonadaceae bacterium]|nr:APC family permease [Pyrinomonadaceae bacterium]
MTDEKLIRGIGRWDLIALIVNGIIGAGIFGLPSKVYALIGSYSLLAFIACAVIIGLIVLCYAEVASRFTSTGGSYLYAREAFGPMVAFEVGWLYWIVRLATFAANCNLFTTYLGFFWPSATEPSIRIVVIGLVIFVLTTVNVVGVRQSAKMTNAFTVGKLLPLLVFALAGLFFLHLENFSFNAVPQYSSFSSAVLLLIYAFVGFEVAVIPAGEVKDPQRNFPFALIFSLVIVALIYLVVQIVSIGTLPGLAASEKPLADAANNFIGPFGAAFIALGALISIMGNLNVSLLGSSRILFAMGEQNEVPRIFAKTHDTFKTPLISLVVNAVIIFVLTVEASFLSALAIATITRLLVYATTCASLPVFRKRSDVPHAKFLAPFGVVAAVLSLVLIAWLMTNVDFTKEGLPIVIVTIVGLIIYYANLIYRRQSVL